MFYQITDFQSVIPLGNTYWESITGTVENLVVQATSTTELSPHARSIENPNDLIEYDFDENQIASNGYSYIEQWYSEWSYTTVFTGANTFDGNDALSVYREQ